MSGEIPADKYLSGLSTEDAKSLENFTDFIRSIRSKKDEYKGIRFGLVVSHASPRLVNAEPFIRLIVLTSTPPLDKKRAVVIPLREDAAGFFKDQNPPPRVSTKKIYEADIVVTYSDEKLPLRIFFGSFIRTPDMDTMISELRKLGSPFVLLHRDRFLPLSSAPSLDEARGRKGVNLKHPKGVS